MRSEWVGQNPQALAVQACSARNLSKSHRLLRLASCAVCRLLSPILSQAPHERKNALGFIAKAEALADGLVDRLTQHQLRRATLAWAGDLGRTFSSVEYDEYGRCVVGTFAGEDDLCFSVQAAVRMAALSTVTGPTRASMNQVLCTTLRDIFGNGVDDVNGWELRRPALAWKWYGPLPPPMQWREPAVSRWRNDGLIRPRWAPDPEAWRTARDIHHAIVESQVTLGILPTHQVRVLGDCLEECGCDDIALLEHLHGPGPHFRGCWAMDALEGKS